MALTPEELKELEGIRAGGGAKALEAEISKHSADKEAQAAAAFDDGLKRADQHTTLVEICASAFAPGSRLFTETGYCFLTTDPLYELGCKNFDLLLYNPQTKKAILPECKSSLASPGSAIKDCRESEAAFNANRAALEAAIGDRIVAVEIVLCIPSEITQKVVRHLEQAEKQGNHAGVHIKIWQVNKFEDQLLQLFTLVPGRAKAFDSQHGDAALTRLLAEGVRVVDSEVLIRFGPQSHPLHVASAIIAALIPGKPGETTDPKRMRRADIIALCSDPKNLAHYAAASLGPNLANRFIRENLQLGLLKEDGKDHVMLAVDGKTLKTILANYQREYRERAIKRSARYLAEEAGFFAYKKTYPPLGSYPEKS